jgi:DNA repair protein RadA/Sms
MRSSGLVEADAGPRVGDGEREAGCAVVLALAGRRAFAVDLQALVVPTEGPPRRQVAGLDPKRFHIVAAVADRAFGGKLRLMRSDLFGASPGGMRLDDPGADLAMAASLASACTGVPPPPGVGFVGELSLTGTVRTVAGMEQRLAAASAAGLERVLGPPDGASEGGAPGPGSGRSRLDPVRHVRDALAWAFVRND